MITIPRVSVIPGVALPLYPARPMRGVPLSNRTVLTEVLQRARQEGAYLTAKLNGDRAVLGKVGGQLHVANRHGGWYSHTVKNLAAWQSLPDQTCLDGEVWQGSFYPFEALVEGGQDLRRQGPAQRALAAKELSHRCGVRFMFPELTEADALRLFRTWAGVRNPQWEGLIWRSAGSPYLIMAREEAEVPAWRKLKWTL